MAIRIKNLGFGVPSRIRKITVSSVTLARRALCYMNAGVLTVAGSGTPVHMLTITAVASTDTTTEVWELKDGDLLEGTYEGSAASLAIGDLVDVGTSGTVFNAADESVGSGGRFRVESIDTTNLLVTAKYLAG